MKTVTFFNTIAELKQLTGLKHRGDLWSVGFNLDDWDWGFVSDTPWTNEPNVNIITFFITARGTTTDVRHPTNQKTY